MLQIITNFDISDTKMDVLNEFNTYYNSWIDSYINDLTFVEMQSKLLCLLQYIHKSIKRNTGLLQLCKLKPNIKLRYISDQTNRIIQTSVSENNNICDVQDPTSESINEETTLENTNIENNTNNQTSDNTENNYEILELGEMLINCISHYASVFEQSDFENLGGPMSRIIENTEKIEKLQKQLYEYQDLMAMFSE